MADKSSDVSRRRILQGAAWTAPAIVVATAVPARAASLDAGGLVFVDFNAFASGSFWDSTASQSIAATTATGNVQNQPTTPGGTSPAVTQFTITFEIPVGSLTSPRWGCGSNAQGIADPATWQHVSGPTVAGGIATLAIRYIGPALPTYSTKQPTVWIQTESAVVGATVNSRVVAVHDNGDTSTDAATDVTVAGLLLVLPLSAGNPVTDWTYTP